MKKVTINSINKKITENAAEYIHDYNLKYSGKLIQIADSIENNYIEKPILLLSGPSGSGKTTTAKKIAEILDGRGIKTHTVSLDNYFLPASRFHEVMDENGRVDYESPSRIDIPLLTKQMEQLSNCEEVTLPRFDFAKQESYEGEKLKREKNDIIVFEGIHALNPLVTSETENFARCMYVSIRTRIEYAEGKLLQPKFIRLMRRIIRDRLYRGRDIKETLDMFDSVERGENLYIMPYKQRAEFSVDTFFPYEAGAYKPIIINQLEKLSETYENFDKFAPLLDALYKIKTVDAKDIPDNALIREFIGGSIYGE